MLRLGLAEILPRVSSDIQNLEHVLLWNKDDISDAKRAIEIEDVNAFLMAQNADELIRAIRSFGPLSPLGTMDDIHDLVRIKQPDTTLLINECDLYPKALNKKNIAPTKRAILRYGLDVDSLMNKDSFVIDHFWCWVALHNVFAIFVELVARSRDSLYPLTNAGFELSSHGMRKCVSSHRLCVDTPPYSWLSHLTWVSSDDSTYLYIPLIHDCERDTADSVLSMVNRYLSPALRYGDGRMVLDTKGMNLIQRLWSVIASATFDLSPLLNETNHSRYYILRCGKCGRCVISGTRGKEKRFCSDSCRVTYYKWKRLKETRLSQTEISVNGKGDAGADAPH